MEYFYILMASLGISGNFIIQKYYQKNYCQKFLSMAQLPFVIACFSVLYYLVLNKGQINFGAFTVGMATLYALCAAYNTIIGLVIMKYCSMAMFSMFIMMGGMFLPFLVGAFYLNEKVNLFRIIAIVLLILGLTFISAQKKNSKISLKGLFLCFSVFVVNGMVSTISKLHQINSAALSTLDFSVWIMISTIVLTGVFNLVLLIERKTPVLNTDSADIKEEKCQEKGRTLLYKMLLILGMVIVFCTGCFFQQIGAKTIDAGMIYPMTSGGSIALTTVFSALLYKEKINKQVLAGLIMTLLATTLFIF